MVESFLSLAYRAGYRRFKAALVSGVNWFVQFAEHLVISAALIYWYQYIYNRYNYELIVWFYIRLGMNKRRCRHLGRKK